MRTALVVSVCLILGACGGASEFEEGGLKITEASPITGPGWSATGSLGTARNVAAAAVLADGRVLITGGYNGSYLVSSELYDPATETWAPTGPLNAARARFTVVRLQDGRVLAIGGSNGPWLSSAEVYDPATGTWSPTGNMPDPRTLHSTTLLPDGRVLLVGGDPFSNKDALLYDPGSGTWSSAGLPSSARANHTATLLQNGKVLVAGGSRYGGVPPTAELYDPATGTWTSAGALNVARISHAAALLPDGRVLVTGGYDYSGTILSNAEVYDPATGTWTLVGSMAAARRFHSATTLPSGKVLIAGGSGSGAVSTSELFHPVTGTFTTIEQMGGGRYGHAALLLQNGQVLAAGGYGNNFLATAERYLEASPDTTLPVTSLTSPAEGSTLLGTVALAATASDNVGIARVEFYAGTTLLGTDTTAPYGVSWDTLTVANGSYSLTSKAVDLSGNVSTSASVSVTVNNVGPNVLTNGEFEGSSLPWVLSGHSYYRTDGSSSHGGTGYNELGTVDYANGTTTQQVAVPTGASTLSFWLKVTSNETTTTTRWDYLYVEVLSAQGSLLATLGTFSNLDKFTTSYAQKSFSVSAFAGQNVQLRFRATTDGIFSTTFHIDDVSVQ